MAIEAVKGRSNRRGIQVTRGLAADLPAVGSSGLEEGDIFIARDGGAGAVVRMYARNAADNAFVWINLG